MGCSEPCRASLARYTPADPRKPGTSTERRFAPAVYGRRVRRGGKTADAASATVYGRPDACYVTTSARATSGLWLETGAVVAVPVEAGDGRLAEAVLAPAVLVAVSRRGTTWRVAPERRDARRLDVFEELPGESVEILDCTVADLAPALRAALETAEGADAPHLSRRRL
jgi:hypothetical protein